jgi:hypothetical protein
MSYNIIIWNWKWKKMLLSISSKYSYFKLVFNYTIKGFWKGTLIHRNCDTLMCFCPLATWAICNAEMMHVISFFLTNVETKQFRMATLFMNFKEIVLHMVHLFAKFVIPPPFVWSYVQLTCIMSCTSRTIWLKQQFIWVHMITRWRKVVQDKCLNKLNP